MGTAWNAVPSHEIFDAHIPAPERRRCQYPDCGAWLSLHNRGDRCFHHPKGEPLSAYRVRQREAKMRSDAEAHGVRMSRDEARAFERANRGKLQLREIVDHVGHSLSVVSGWRREDKKSMEKIRAANPGDEARMTTEAAAKFAVANRGTMSYEAIAEAVGYSRTTVATWLDEHDQEWAKTELATAAAPTLGEAMDELRTANDLQLKELEAQASAVAVPMAKGMELPKPRPRRKAEPPKASAASPRADVDDEPEPDESPHEFVNLKVPLASIDRFLVEQLTPEQKARIVEERLTAHP